ncbi:hypothetical protein CYY_009841 [Polysphondylium violaceum]|uniref:Phospholipase B-like n=1 Tax=Polysphondylium violaceum TaxID=133409 RepID=A0A8J4V072_9MYCE|nr:hypothetical protein CYY_009841 [Polysphondylium violaceum]
MKLKVLGILLLLLNVNIYVHSFDTGHHGDITANAMQIRGYGKSARDVSVLLNWFPDFFAYTPIQHIKEAQLLHFDNIYTLQNATDYFGQLIYNSKSGFEQIAKEGNTLQYLGLLGVTLHTIQDFYAHTNWVEIHSPYDCDCVRSETFMEGIHAANGNLTQLYGDVRSLASYSWGEDCSADERNCFPGTNVHGDYCGGINKDSYVRKSWQQAYATAFAASVEWIYNVELWVNAVNKEIVTNAKAYTPATETDQNDLSSNLYDSVVVSYGAKTTKDDGHYKGPGSGSLKRFGYYSERFLASNSIYKKLFTQDKIYNYLVTPDIYNASTVKANTKSPDLLPFVEVYHPLTYFEKNLYSSAILRTTYVKTDDKFNSPSPFAIVTMGPLEFIDAVQIDKTEFRPYWTDFFIFPFSQNESVPIIYKLLNDKLLDGNEQMNLDDNDGVISMTMQPKTAILSGEATGLHNTSSSELTYVLGGTTVKILVMTKQIGSCSLSSLPDPICGEWAWPQQPLNQYCDVSELVTSSSSNLILMFTSSNIMSILLLILSFTFMIHSAFRNF